MQLLLFNPVCIKIALQSALRYHFAVLSLATCSEFECKNSLHDDVRVIKFSDRLKSTVGSFCPRTTCNDATVSAM